MGSMGRLVFRSSGQRGHLVSDFGHLVSFFTQTVGSRVTRPRTKKLFFGLGALSFDLSGMYAQTLTYGCAPTSVATGAIPQYAART